MPDYYDLVLGAIPLTVAGVAGSLLAVGMAAALAVALASTVAAGIVGHAMFVRTPGRESVTESVTDATTRSEAPAYDVAD